MCVIRSTGSLWPAANISYWRGRLLKIHLPAVWRCFVWQPILDFSKHRRSVVVMDQTIQAAEFATRPTRCRLPENFVPNTAVRTSDFTGTSDWLETVRRGSWGYCFLCNRLHSPFCASTEGIYGRPLCRLRYCNFQFLTAVLLNVQIFCDVTPYRLVNSKPIFCIIITPSSSESSSWSFILKMPALRSAYPITWRNMPEKLSPKAIIIPQTVPQSVPSTSFPLRHPQ